MDLILVSFLGLASGGFCSFPFFGGLNTKLVLPAVTTTSIRVAVASLRGTAARIFSPTTTSTSTSLKDESIGDKRDTEDDVFELEFVGEGPIEFADTAAGRNDEESTGTNAEEEEAGTVFAAGTVFEAIADTIADTVTDTVFTGGTTTREERDFGVTAPNRAANADDDADDDDAAFASTRRGPIGDAPSLLSVSVLILMSDILFT